MLGLLLLILQVPIGILANIVANYLQQLFEEHPRFNPLPTTNKLFIFLFVFLILQIPALWLSLLMSESSISAGRQTQTTTPSELVISEMREKFVPKDVLSEIHPGTSLSRAREILGAPYRESEVWRETGSMGGTSLIYKFANLYVQIESLDDKTIDLVTIVKPSMRDRDLFDVYPLDFKLGQVKFGDVMSYCGKLEVRTSSKDAEATLECYFGNPGNYRYYTFGTYIGGGIWHETLKFSVDLEEKVTGDVAGTRPNFVSISVNEGDGHPIYHGELR